MDEILLKLAITTGGIGVGLFVIDRFFKLVPQIIKLFTNKKNNIETEEPGKIDCYNCPTAKKLQDYIKENEIELKQIRNDLSNRATFTALDRTRDELKNDIRTAIRELKDDMRAGFSAIQETLNSILTNIGSN